VRRVRNLAIAIGLAIGISFAPGTSASAATATDVQVHYSAVDKALLSPWVPWDGNLMRSAFTCAQRRTFISQTYHIPIKYLRCDRIDPLPPCSQVYYMLMVDQGRPPDAIAPTEPTRRTEPQLC
jgi:hypothetical protein